MPARTPAPAAIPAPSRGLYADEPEACRRDPRQLLPILAHLGLLLAVFKLYNVEGRAFQMVVTFALMALPVHYYLPYRWKKPCFVAVSAAGLAWVFGLATAGYVLLLGALLIGICYLPVAWIVRASGLGALALGLALLRPESFGSGIPGLVWPVLASMFMFRMIIYMYELKYSQNKESFIDTISYFFILPNYCFLHFPVVDYRTMQRGYFARDIHLIQRSGLQMMFRGTTHLLVYRLVYHELLIPAEEVHNLLSLAGYLACNYLLYLRVSGQFHMACGMLHLFGYQLPTTHHHYLLASGFTDYWRRINIYWKDFMVRIVFNPVVFHLKRRPQPLALAAATSAVFVTTWLLHAYQSYWLRGTWGFSVPDALFWGILGVLVLVGVQRDARRPRGVSEPLFVRTARTVATFAAIALLWSLWSSPSIGAWISMLQRGLQV
jgi:D-alanyl-lipoteichoic acid acyltransferase DltB (MBOAT superfamily)